jgi:hypothetical protein
MYAKVALMVSSFASDAKKNLPEGRYKLGSSPSVNKPILEHVVEFVSKQK